MYMQMLNKGVFKQNMAKKSKGLLFRLFFVLTIVLMILGCDKLSDSLTNDLTDFWDDSSGISDDLVEGQPDNPSGTYAIMYYLNTGTDESIEPQNVKNDQPVMLRVLDESTVAPPGKKFVGWVTDKNYPSSIYFGKQEYDLSKHIQKDQDGKRQVVLYAYWINKNAFVVMYSRNSATSGDLPVLQTKEGGEDLILARNVGSLVREKYRFTGWNSNKDGQGTHYDEGGSYVKDSILPFLQLYAEWTPIFLYPVSYHANGADSGNVPDEQQKTSGESLTLSDNIGKLMKTGKVFVAWNTQSDGKGTSYREGDEYTQDGPIMLYAEWWIPIISADDFQKMRDNLAESFLLQNDIVLPDSFQPIGTGSMSFTGIFKGQGHSLSNLKLIQPNDEILGFFLQLENANISNLIFKKPEVQGKGSSTTTENNSAAAGIGVLAGFMRGSGIIKGVKVIDERVTKATVKATGRFAGLLIGRIEGDKNTPPIIENCELTGTVEGTYDVGGVLGFARNTKIKESKTAAKVKSVINAGGLVGNQDNGNISKSYVVGTVTGISYIGGLVGLQTDSSIDESYSISTVTGSGNGIGGLVGKQTDCSIRQSYVAGQVTGSVTAKGLVGLQSRGGVQQSYFASDITKQTIGIGGDNANGVTAYISTDLTGTDKFTDWNFSDSWRWMGFGKWPILNW